MATGRLTLTEVWLQFPGGQQLTVPSDKLETPKELALLLKADAQLCVNMRFTFGAITQVELEGEGGDVNDA